MLVPRKSAQQAYRDRYGQLHIQGLVSTVCAVVALMLTMAVALPRMHFSQFLVAWLLAELLFHMWFRLHARRIAAQPALHRPPQHSDPLLEFKAFVHDAPSIRLYTTLERCISRWFGDVPFDQIKRENVAELFAYGFWYRSREEMHADGFGDIFEQIPALLENSWGLKFMPGYNPHVQFNAHIWQPLRFWHFPLGWYVVAELLGVLRHISLTSCGFTYHRHSGLVYYTYGLPSPKTGSTTAGGRGGNDSSRGCTPILFLHGVGVGLLPYVAFVQRLAATGHPVVAVECRHLTMRLCREVPDCDTVAQCCLSILDRHSLPDATVVSHSFGTFLAARLLQRAPQRVHGLCLIDPVCFLLFTGQLVNNFVYRPAVLGLLKQLAAARSVGKVGLLAWSRELLVCLRGLCMAIPSCLISRELHCAASVARRFYWSTLNLRPQQLPSSSVVVLSGEDKVTPTREIKCALDTSQAPIRILHQPTHAHAQFLADGGWQDVIVQEVLEAAGLSIVPPHQLPKSCAPTSPIRVHAYHDSASSITYKGL